MRRSKTLIGTAAVSINQSSVGSVRRVAWVSNELWQIERWAGLFCESRPLHVFVAFCLWSQSGFLKVPAQHPRHSTTSSWLTSAPGSSSAGSSGPTRPSSSSTATKVKSDSDTEWRFFKPNPPYRAIFAQYQYFLHNYLVNFFYF